MRRRDVWRAVAIVSVIAAACAERTPPPGPERSPSPTIPSCLTDADCSGGEECRDGVCVRHGTDESVEAPSVLCPGGCPPPQICADGVCVGRLIGDGGPEELPCGGC